MFKFTLRSQATAEDSLCVLPTHKITLFFTVFVELMIYVEIKNLLRQEFTLNLTWATDMDT